MRALSRPAWVEVDLECLESNLALISGVVEPSSICAVVKADAYGHGAPIVAHAAIAGGAKWLAVATVEEGVVLREAGIGAPILVLSEPGRHGVEQALIADLRLSAYKKDTLLEASAAAERISGRSRLPTSPLKIHLKVDTGMHRVGADPTELVEMAQICKMMGIEVEGLWTHLAVADKGAEGGEFTNLQLARFEDARLSLASIGITPGILHVANSAGALFYPEARYDMVRCGIAMYGYSPSSQEIPGLRPAISLKGRVAHLRRLDKGEAVSYGLRRTLTEESTIATVPLGYADGVPRSLFELGQEVLVGGVRRPIAGVITMDQIMVDCGDLPVFLGDEVVLLGRQGTQSIDPSEWAEKLSTITYEIVARIGARVPRLAVRPSSVNEGREEMVGRGRPS